MITYTPSWKNDFDFECEYIPSWYNDFDFPYLGCDNILGEIDIHDGCGVSGDIVVGVEWNLVHGQHLSFELTQADIPWEFVCSDGSDVGFRISPSANFGTTMWQGESLSGDLKTYGFVYLSSNSWHGDNVRVQLSLDRIFSFDAFSGDIVSSDIRYSIADDMKYDIGHGEQVSFDLNFNSTSVRGRIEHGESVIIDRFITVNPVPLTPRNIEFGSEITNSILTNEYHFNANHYHESGSCVADIINTEDGLWRVRHGELTLIELSADYGLPTTLHSGEQVSADLLTRDPVHISASAVDGHSWHVDLRHLYSPPLYPYPIVNDSWFDVAIDPAWTHFSTCKSCKLPIVHDALIIRLERFEDIRETWSAEIGTATSFELTRDIRPEITIDAGEMMTGSMDTIVETEPNIMFDGSGVYPFYLTTDEKTSTDRTNPILDGNEIITDNGSPEQTPEDFLTTRAGEQCFAKLAIPRLPKADLTGGEFIVLDLSVYEPWEIKIRHGEHLNVVNLSTTVRLNFNVFDGEEQEQTFYDPPTHIYHGEHMEFRMKLTYDVEWQEAGCLDNEWTYENKNDNTPVVIEQTPFRHSLKARCY